MKGGYKLPSTSEALAKHRAKKKHVSVVNEVARMDNETMPSTLTQPQSKGAESSKGVIPDDQKTLTITIPTSTSINSEAASMGNVVESLLLPKDQHQLTKLGVMASADWCVSQALQVLTGCIFLKQTISIQKKRNQDLFNTNTTLQKQTAKAKKKEKKWKAKMKEMEVELNESKIKLRDIEAKLATSVREIVSLKERLDIVSIDAILKTRAKLMMEFKAGKFSEWKPDEDIELWRETEEKVAEEERNNEQLKGQLLEFATNPIRTQTEPIDGVGVQIDGGEINLLAGD